MYKPTVINPQEIFERNNLPETYKGFSTLDLLDVWARLCTPKGCPGTSREKLHAMGGLLQEFKLAPVFQVKLNH
jgi:hypothetical protein